MTMTIHDWARRWHIQPAALNELMRLFGVFDPLGVPEGEQGGATEAANQNNLRLNMSKAGGRLWRNNVGAGYMRDGSFIRWGLANDSKAMNEKIKSSDLIGLRPVLIRPEHVGTLIGQFVAREVKPEGWIYRATARERAQLAFKILVSSLGGDAKFSTTGDDV